MRDTKFRGLERGENPRWIYGDYALKDEGDARIYDRKVHVWTPVVESTVGQYTGLKDSAGNEIYEGDKVWIVPDSRGYFVKWGKAEWMLERLDGSTSIMAANMCCKYVTSKITGNIYEKG